MLNTLKRALLASCMGVTLAAAPTLGLAETPADQLVVGQSLSNILSLDPAAMSGRESMEINANIYDRLIEADVNDPAVFHPRLAESFEIAEDRNSVTFHLRRDAVFHSGNPVTAHDFVWSMTRAFELGIGGSNIRVFGYNEDNIAEMVTATDDHTVVMKLPKPHDPTLILAAVAGQGVTMVIDSKLAMENAKDNDFGQGWLTTHSAGSGPYRLDRWLANDIVLLQRVDGHWGGEPAMARLIYRHMPESQTKRLALEAGDIDIAWGMSVADVAALQSNEALEIAEVTSGNMYYLMSSMADEKFQDPRVREALRYLIDYEGIAETILPYYARLHQRPLGKGLDGSLPDTGYALDPEKAKALLAEAGYPDGMDVSLRVLAEAPFINVATAIQATLAQGGIRAELITGNSDQIYGAARERKFELLVGRGGDRTGTHPYTSLLSLVYNPDNSDEAKLFTLQAWRASFQSEEINTLLDGALLEGDPDTRREMYERIQEIWEEEVGPLQVMAQGLDAVVYQDDIVNYVPHVYQTTVYRDVTKQR